VKDLFEKFAADHPRNPHPDKLTWEAADTVHNRAHWLVIDEFGKARAEAAEMADMNILPQGQLFNRSKQSGRVDLTLTGNIVRAETRGVTAFTLLLSPDKFDFNQPIQVIANGREVFNGRMERNVKTLLKWSAKDNDRTMLYAAELKIKLPK
jgi:hypothetical protein